MASYHSSFSYNGINSAKDMGLIIVAFDPDNGLMDTFLSMDVITDDYYDGTKVYTYGSKYNTQATVKITVVKRDCKDFSLKKVRECLKWLTGARTDSWLDMYIGDEIKYSFLGRVTNVQQRKMDARTVGLEIEFSSVSPWAYSAPQVFDRSIFQELAIDSDGVLINIGGNISISEDGVLCNSMTPGPGACFLVDDNDNMYVKDQIVALINNETDDLYTYIYLDIKFINQSCTWLEIQNDTLKETTKINNLKSKDIIYITNKQFIIAYSTDEITGNLINQNRIFGDDFNFVWPRLAPGDNMFIIDGNGNGTVQFTYRYPMKVGDCAMDITIEGGMDCGGCEEVFPYDTVPWEKITDTPTSIVGYGINNAYTKVEVDQKIADNGNANISEEELQKMLSDTLG